MTNQEKEVFTVKEAADYLGISIRTMYDLVKNQEVRAKRVRHQWRIHKQALVAYLMGEGDK